MDQRNHEAFTEFRGYIAKLSQLNTKELTKHKLNLIQKTTLIVQNGDLFLVIIQLNCHLVNGIGSLHQNSCMIMFHLIKQVLYPSGPLKQVSIQVELILHVLNSPDGQHLGTNTLPMLKVCSQVRGFGHDVHSVQGDNNTLNHWIYEFENQFFVFASRFTKFLSMYDGVHLLLKDRTEVGKEFVSSIIYSKKDPNHIYSDYSPAHYYHNWRFNNVNKNLDTQNK